MEPDAGGRQVEEPAPDERTETERWAAMALELTPLDHRHQLRYDYADYVDRATAGNVKVTLVFWCDLTPSIVCPQCGQRSWNPPDLVPQDCGACRIPW